MVDNSKSERAARIRLENDLKSAHQRLLKIEAEMQQLKLAVKNRKDERVKDIRERITDMIVDYKERFKWELRNLWV